jgi:hypothetical protein
MDIKIARDTLKVIRKERKRRLASLPDDPSIADHLWRSADEPFVNDLCLMLLVAIRHQVERELLILAALVTDDGTTTLSLANYEKRLNKARKSFRKKEGRKTLAAKLKIDSTLEQDLSMNILRMLVNGYKHTPSQAPERPLLRKLGLDPTRNYATLPESPAFREGLARSLNLDTHADFCDIAGEFLKRADRFLSAVRQQSTISIVKGRRGSARPSSFLC